MEKTESVNTKEKSLMYYIFLPLISYNGIDNYFTIKYKEYITDKKILPENIRIVKINKISGYISFETDKCELYNADKIPHGRIIRQDDTYYLFIGNKKIKQIVDIINGTIDYKNDVLIKILNFYSIYVRFDNLISKHIFEQDMDLIKDLILHLENSGEDIYKIYMLVKTKFVMQKCLHDDLGVKTEDMNTLENYVTYRIKKELGELTNLIV